MGKGSRAIASIRVVLTAIFQQFYYAGHKEL